MSIIFAAIVLRVFCNPFDIAVGGATMDLTIQNTFSGKIKVTKGTVKATFSSHFLVGNAKIFGLM